MLLANTKEYYRDIAHHYFCIGKMYLMQHFLDLHKNSRKQNTFNTEDTKDWFKWSQTPRPVWDTEMKAYVGDIF